MILEVAGLTARYGLVTALDAVSLGVERGEIVSLIGTNGAGKTTLLRTISGLVKPAAGTVTFGGQAIHGRPAHGITSRGLVHVPEGRRIFGSLTVDENLQVGGFGSRRQRQVLRERRDLAFSLFPILAERGSQLGGLLSGGEQQMLAVARGLMSGPSAMLLDEPTLGLSPMAAADVLASLAALVESGVAVLLVEQNARAALQVAARGYVIEHGRIVIEGTAASLRSDPRVEEVFLGTATLHRADRSTPQ